MSNNFRDNKMAQLAFNTECRGKGRDWPLIESKCLTRREAGKDGFGFKLVTRFADEKLGNFLTDII